MDHYCPHFALEVQESEARASRREAREHGSGFESFTDASPESKGLRRLSWMDLDWE